MQETKPNFAIHTPETTYYCSICNLFSKIQFDFPSIFHLYLEFYNSKLNKVGYIWKLTSLASTFIKKHISNSFIY